MNSTFNMSMMRFFQADNTSESRQTKQASPDKRHKRVQTDETSESRQTTKATPSRQHKRVQADDKLCDQRGWNVGIFVYPQEMSRVIKPVFDLGNSFEDSRLRDICSYLSQSISLAYRTPLVGVVVNLKKKYISSSLKILYYQLGFFNAILIV